MSGILAGQLGTLWAERKIEKFIDQRTTANDLKRVELLLKAAEMPYLGREARDRAADMATRLLGIDTDGLRG